MLHPSSVIWGRKDADRVGCVVTHDPRLRGFQELRVLSYSSCVSVSMSVPTYAVWCPHLVHHCGSDMVGGTHTGSKVSPEVT